MQAHKAKIEIAQSACLFSLQMLRNAQIGPGQAHCVKVKQDVPHSPKVENENARFLLLAVARLGGRLRDDFSSACSCFGMEPLCPLDANLFLGCQVV